MLIHLMLMDVGVLRIDLQLQLVGWDLTWQHFMGTFIDRLL